MRTTLLLLASAAAIPAQTVPKPQRYGVLPYTSTHFAMPKYRALADWEARRGQLRAQVLTAAGLLPMPPRGKLNVQRYGHTAYGTYAVDKITIEPFPGFFLAGNVYYPLNNPGRHPGVLIAHGHWKHGRVEDIPTYSVPALGANLAAQGYVAFAYDMVGYNDTRQTPHEFGMDEDDLLWSFSALGLQLWNSIRALDYLESRSDVDASRLAVTGASGGGTQTYLLTAADDRIRVSAPVNMVSGIMQGSSDCENAGGLRVGTSNIELAALAAPRPMLLVSTTRDWTKHTPKEEFPQIRHIYDLYGRRGNLAFFQSHAEHNYDRASREAVYAFFRKHLLKIADGAAVPETVLKAPAEADLLLGDTFQPVGALTFDELFAEWQRISARQTQDMTTAEIAARLAFVTGASWPMRLEYSKSGSRVYLRRAGTDDRVRTIWLPGAGPNTVVAVHPDGAEAARYQDLVEEARRRGDSVLIVETFGTGKTKPYRYAGGRHFYTFNRSEDALRVQDVLTGLAFADYYTEGRLTLAGFQSAASWCVLAAALAPPTARIRVDFPGVTERQVSRVPFIPGLLRAGGLEAAARVVEERTGETLAMFHTEARVAQR